MRMQQLLSALIVLGVAASAGAALAQDSTSVEVLVRWTSGPLTDDDGRPLAAAIRYDVYLESDGADEVRVAQVDGDTTAVLALSVGQVHRVRVVGYDDRDRPSPPSDWSDAVAFEDDRGDEEVPGAPPRAALPPNLPNPFNPETTIVYGVPDAVPAGGRVSLEIYRPNGSRVRTFAVDRSPGFHEVAWDGTDELGRPQSTGVYLTRFVCGDEVQTRKMTMVK